jgi:hypothetical protein
MITKTGVVTMTNTDTQIEGFTFAGATMPSAQLEALHWARDRLDAAILAMEHGNPDGVSWSPGHLVELPDGRTRA